MKNEDREESNAFASLIHKSLQSSYYLPRILRAIQRNRQPPSPTPGLVESMFWWRRGAGDAVWSRGSGHQDGRSSGPQPHRAQSDPRHPLVTTSLVLRPSINRRWEDRALLTTLLWPWKRNVHLAFNMLYPQHLLMDPPLLKKERAQEGQESCVLFFFGHVWQHVGS